MSCSNATAPIDIESTKAGTCSLKCTYNFKYNNSACNVSNEGKYLSFKYDMPNGTPPVKYNNVYYTVSDIRIYQPSLHTYKGQHADAEMIIVHSGAGKNLLVCLPLVKSGASSKSATLFDAIMPEINQRALNEGENTLINVPNFNLDSFVPNTAFYAYTGTLPYVPCTGTYDYVVYDKYTSPVTISSSAFKILQNVISKNSVTIKPTVDLYYNKSGSNSALGENDIYIECNPTGADGKVLVPAGSKTDDDTPKKQITWEEVSQNPFFQVFVGIVVGLIIFKGGHYVFSKFKDNKITMPKIGKKIGIK